MEDRRSWARTVKFLTLGNLYDKLILRFHFFYGQALVLFILVVPYQITIVHL